MWIEFKKRIFDFSDVSFTGLSTSFRTKTNDDNDYNK